MICHPETDWGCAYTNEQLVEMREDAKKAKAMQRAEALAWTSLAALTAYQIGVCPIEIRPCAARCAPTGSWMVAPAGGSSLAGLPTMTIGASFTPHISGGNWVNSCGCGTGDCSCSSVSEVYLPGPVGAIESVRIDGELVDPSRYRVDNGNRLTSMDPNLVWPVCQDMRTSSDEIGSFAVTYYRGAAPNEMTQYAAGVLATEFYKACTGDSKCRLPRGIRTVTRGNASYEIDSTIFENGLTQIPEVDAVIRIYNPHLLKSAPRVLSPDGPTFGRRTTWIGA